MTNATFICSKCGKRHAYDPISPGECTKGRRRKRREVASETMINGRLNPDGSTTLTLPLPVSKNEEPSHPMALHRYRFNWKDRAGLAWMCAGQPRYQTVVIQPVLYFKDSRARDYDNYTGQAMKGILDGLKLNMFPEDNSEVCQLRQPVFELDKQNPRMELIVAGLR